MRAHDKRQITLTIKPVWRKPALHQLLALSSFSGFSISPLTSHLTIFNIKRNFSAKKLNKFFYFSFSGSVFVCFEKKNYFKNQTSTKPPHDAHQQPQNLLSNSTTLSKNEVNLSLSQDHLPSRWYTVLALPFPDQKLARRDISTFGRHGFYQSRAGFFSEPSPPLWKLAKTPQHDNAIICHSFDFQNHDNHV